MAGQQTRIIPLHINGRTIPVTVYSNNACSTCQAAPVAPLEPGAPEKPNPQFSMSQWEAFPWKLGDAPLAVQPAPAEQVAQLEPPTSPPQDLGNGIVVLSR